MRVRKICSQHETKKEPIFFPSRVFSSHTVYGEQNSIRLVSLYCSHASSAPDLIPGTEHSFVPSPCLHSSNPAEGKNIKELLILQRKLQRDKKVLQNIYSSQRQPVTCRPSDWKGGSPVYGCLGSAQTGRSKGTSYKNLP